MKYEPNAVSMRVMCSSRIDPQHILYAFKQGADGVFLGGCHPGDCHYVEGNYKTLRRIMLFRPMLEKFGINSQRLKLEWISAAEGKKFVKSMNEFTQRIRTLGPLNIQDIALNKEEIK
jgi:F420-non-reducing hydrogenase iron-sulfur subunit